MKLLHIIFCVAIAALLVAGNRLFVPADAATYGGLSLVGWLSILAFVGVLGFVAVAGDAARAATFFRRRDIMDASAPKIRTLDQNELRELELDKYRGPSYPHPIIFPDRCIGCQACVDACPHDVLAIVDGRASAVAPDLCMEDTACQAECPVNPKACIVINTTKEVRSLPTPTRNGATFETNVPGCYIIGDVSGVPLIKNAVKEGAEVIARIREELAAALPDPKAEYDVAIIGIGPGGASAVAAAHDAGLRYVGIEQNNILSTIDLYPKGKYIFFKPDTKDWDGGIPAVGLGLAKAKYGGDAADDDSPVIDTAGPAVGALIQQNASAVHDELIAKIPQQLRGELSPMLREKAAKEMKRRVAAFLRSKGSGDWAAVSRQHLEPAADQLGAEFRADVVDQLQRKIPGDQRENILAIWLGSLEDRGAKINEYESCKSVTRAEAGDGFVINTELAADKSQRTYRSRRVIIAIGLRGAPNKLRLKDEEKMTVTLDGREMQKVHYGLSEPMAFRGKKIVVVGGGNVAVEAAVDLVCVRDGNSISPRKPEDMNQVTVLVRDFLAPTVKFGNKLQLYSCAERGLLDLRFGVGIKEMREREVVLEDVPTKREIEIIENDLVFALIGGERPNRFLESIGIEIK
ncbi:MAG: NAD(P)-binding domain-containing protein [Acidobacteria bacterium]|nr:NAD(P)-binding domain-containing protein [Acidobacteriota bacterium]